MTTTTSTAMAPAFSPTDAGQRIDALDVLRGFALVGVCVANVEFFNRPVVESGSGIPAGLHGADWIVSWLVNYLVSGKFWTIFSLLFRMGFALMQERAQAAGRPFVPAYGRRIGALLAIGLLHHVFLWSGDILISYAVAAAALMLTMFAPPRVLITAFIACAALPQMPGLGFLAWFLAPIIFAAIVGIYLRSEHRMLLALLAAVPGALMLVAALAAASGGKAGVDWFLLVTGTLLLAFGILAWRHGETASARPLRAGLAIVLVAYFLVTVESGTRYFAPQQQASAAAGAASADAGDQALLLRAREQAVRSEQETNVLTSPSYLDDVSMRLDHLLVRMHDEVGFSIVLVGVVLLGSWFVRAGVIARSAEHLPLFRRLALFGIPVGVGLGMLGSLVSTGRRFGVDDPAYDFANGLMLLGSVPAALGYIGALMLMLHSRGPLSRVRMLAPFGRMALSNYLLQSVVFSLLFYGYALGLWGIGRPQQLAIALLLCALQIGLSHWWLARYRYGPAEWLWRALTYLSRPAMRR